MSEYVCEITPIDSETWDTVIGEEIVRCRDCRYSEPDQSDHDYREPLACKLYRTDVPELGYCHRGQRRGDAE